MTEPDRGSQDPIREALRQLPRVTASPSFNRRLLERAGAPTTRRVLAWPRLVAATLLLATTAAGLYLVLERNQRLDQERQRATLERRHDELRRELAEIRERAVRSPRLYLGTASDVDLVLDLEPWMNQPSAAQPVAYANSRP